MKYTFVRQKCGFQTKKKKRKVLMS